MAIERSILVSSAIDTESWWPWYGDETRYGVGRCWLITQ